MLVKEINRIIQNSPTAVKLSGEIPGHHGRATNRRKSGSRSKNGKQYDGTRHFVGYYNRMWIPAQHGCSVGCEPPSVKYDVTDANSAGFTAQGTMTLFSVFPIIHEPITTLSSRLSLGRDVSARGIVDIVLFCVRVHAT